MDHVEAVKTLAVERYLLEEMPEAERESFEEHCFSCGECADDVGAAAAMRDGVRSGLALEQDAVLMANRARVVPLRPAVARWRSSVALPWAAVALLSIGLGYQTVQGRWPSRRQAGSFAPTPATLRPASRGQEAVVSPGPGAILTLAVDLGGAPFDRDIRYELSRADGTVITSGEAPTPVPGAPLLLMVSGAMLKDAERYVLTLHHTGAPNLTPATYRFRVRLP